MKSAAFERYVRSAVDELAPGTIRYESARCGVGLRTAASAATRISGCGVSMTSSVSCSRRRTATSSPVRAPIGISYASISCGSTCSLRLRYSAPTACPTHSMLLANTAAGQLSARRARFSRRHLGDEMRHCARCPREPAAVDDARAGRDGIEDGRLSRLNVVLVNLVRVRPGTLVTTRPRSSKLRALHREVHADGESITSGVGQARRALAG